MDGVERRLSKISDMNEKIIKLFNERLVDNDNDNLLLAIDSERDEIIKTLNNSGKVLRYRNFLFLQKFLCTFPLTRIRRVLIYNLFGCTGLNIEPVVKGIKTAKETNIT